jgi:Ca-activated chloride channel family protein
MNFAAPGRLWLLLFVLPPLIAFYWWSWRKRQQLITQFTSERLLGHLKVGVSPSRQKARMVMISAAVLLLILTLARPQWGVTREEAHQRGLDIIIAIDTSNSMLAQDVPPNRLARAKLAALDLMRRAKTDRLGLIAFAGSAFLECPLTLDDAAFSQNVDSLDTQTISQGGTAINEAIDEARRAFKKEADSHKALVIFTDGEDHEGDPIESAKAAAKDGIAIFTIGLGSAEGELLRVRDERGRVDYIRDEQGQPVKSKLDEGLLQQIARATEKGFYLPLRGTKTMDSLYDQGIALLPKSETATKSFQRYHERYQWPLLIAIGLLILEIFLPDRKRRRSARSAPATSTMTTITETVAVLLLFALPAVAWGSPSSALREYNDGNYQGAFKDYNKLLDKKDDPRLHFNAGAAAYQSRDLENAKKEFSEALASPDLPLQQRSYYNLGNTLFRIGQQMPDTSKKQEAWENAVKQYESALKLNAQDGDAKFNQDFVKKQLELLKQQQQQQQQSNDKNNKDKNQNQDKQNQDQKNQDQKNQDNKDNKDKNSQDQKDKQNQRDQNSSNQKNESDKDKQQNQSQQDKDKQKEQEAQKQKEQADKQKQNQAENQPKEKSQEDAEREAAAIAAGEMTPQQAQQLLDSQKNDDQVLRLAPPNKNQLQSRSFKNW